MVHHVIAWLLGLFTWMLAVSIGQAFRKQNGPDYNYVCPEENCHFIVKSDEKGKVDEAVVSHWRYHP